jgi:DNA-binding transcriptional MerR regulator
MEGVKQIPDRIYFRIGDVADLVGVKPYVLRYWESEFPMISPEKSATGQRVYRRGDVETLMLIRHLLYDERYSIEGARRRIRELRRDGELRSFKQRKLGAALGTEEPAPAAETPAQAPAPGSTERRERIRALATELRELAAVPVETFFG